MKWNFFWKKPQKNWTRSFHITQISFPFLTRSRSVLGSFVNFKVRKKKLSEKHTRTHIETQHKLLNCGRCIVVSLVAFHIKLNVCSHLKVCNDFKLHKKFACPDWRWRREDNERHAVKTNVKLADKVGHCIRKFVFFKSKRLKTRERERKSTIHMCKYIFLLYMLK